MRQWLPLLAVVVAQSPASLLPTPKSPLGALPEHLPEHLQEERFFEEDVEKLPECQKVCGHALSQTFAAALRLGDNHVRRFEAVCSEYEQAWGCLGRVDCGPTDIFATLTSGIEYMCHEQRHAFNATIECMDAQADALTRECGQMCNAQSVMMQWALRSMTRMSSAVRPGAAGGGGSDFLSSLLGARAETHPEKRGERRKRSHSLLPMGSGNTDIGSMRQFTAEACQVSECLLDCLRSKLNARCDGSAGTLLAEVLMRPVAMGQERMATLPMGELLTLLLPEQCSFLYDRHDMERFRIDPNLDRDLKRMYLEKALKGQQLMEGDEEMRLPPSLSTPFSPFDSDHTLDDLIRQHYGDGMEGSGVEGSAEEGSGKEDDQVIYKGVIEGSSVHSFPFSSSNDSGILLCRFHP